MRRYVVLGLLLMLVTAQQGAVLHELSHICRQGSAQSRVEVIGLGVKTCEQCLAYSQVVNPAAHSTPILLVVPPAALPLAAPHYCVIARQAPAPRSRGPPLSG